MNRELYPPPLFTLPNEAALLGRADGTRQRGSTHDYMRSQWEFTDRVWSSYVTGFYRGFGFVGAGNRAQRRAADSAHAGVAS